MPLQIKMIVLGIISAMFLALGWTAKHYHEKYIDVTAQLAAQKVSLDQALEAAKSCSDNTDKLAEAVKQKEADIARAQELAQVLAAKKQSNSNQILAKEASTPGNSCKSAEDLFRDYKRDMVKR